MVAEGVGAELVPEGAAPPEPVGAPAELLPDGALVPDAPGVVDPDKAPQTVPWKAIAPCSSSGVQLSFRHCATTPWKSVFVHTQVTLAL